MRRPLIVVAEPCDVPIDSMEPRGRGHYCGRCDRIVEDLSALTEREALARLTAAGDDLCGALAHDALGRPIFAPEPRRPWLAAVAVAATALAACTPEGDASEAAPITLSPEPNGPRSNARAATHANTLVQPAALMQPVGADEAPPTSTDHDAAAALEGCALDEAGAGDGPIAAADPNVTDGPTVTSIRPTAADRQREWMKYRSRHPRTAGRIQRR